MDMMLDTHPLALPKYQRDLQIVLRHFLVRPENRENTTQQQGNRATAATEGEYNSATGTQWPQRENITQQQGNSGHRGRIQLSNRATVTTDLVFLALLRY